MKFTPALLSHLFLTAAVVCAPTALAVEAPAKPAPKAAAAKAAPLPPGDPTKPSPKQGNARFFQLHESFVKRTKSGPVGVLFLGDSITEGWNKAPAVWKSHYEQWQPANFGIGGDRVEHVLWRIENGELEGISPKVAVVMIGTNNTGANGAPEIAAGIRKLVGNLRTKLPTTKVLLLAVFPRGPRSADPAVVAEAKLRMDRIKEINADIAKLDDGKMVRFLDINEKFLVNGVIPNDVMPDQLHPNVKGYQIWAEAMQPTLEALMK